MVGEEFPLPISRKEPKMKLQEETVGNVTIFHLTGKIMGGPETQEIRNRLKELIASGKQFLVLNFQDVRWINSTGVGVIISCLITLRNRGGDVRFANLHGATQHYFHITKLDIIVEIFDSIDDAVASFSEA